MKTVNNLIICVFVLALVGTARGATLYVPSSDYPTIQSAINAASNGDEIKVASGEYKEAIKFKGKAIKLYSSAGPDFTTINGNGAYHVVQCVNGEGRDTRLEGFTITGGKADGIIPPLDRGAGMYNVGSSPSVHWCFFKENSARGFFDLTFAHGAGMYNLFSSPKVTACTFSNNIALHGGGGMYNSFSNPEVSNCTFINNQAIGNIQYGSGGGMYNEYCNPKVTGCTFESNYVFGEGGGIYNWFSGPEVDGCTFRYNKTSGGSGGGMCNAYGNPKVSGCGFTGNRTNGNGAGMYNWFSGPEVTNCTFSGNHAEYPILPVYGGGMCNMFSNAIVKDCTFNGNSAKNMEPLPLFGYGGGMYNGECNPKVTNCDFIDNSANNGGGMWNSLAGTEVTDCTFKENEVVKGYVIPFMDGFGGGMGNDFCNPTVTNCTFSENSSYWEGGGMYNGASGPSVTDCTFSDNSANNGGGMFNSLSFPSVTNCKFSDNTASYGGGGMGNDACNPSVTNCTFTGNTADDGGGIYNWSSGPSVTNCTLIYNSADWHGGGIFNWISNPTVTNCILWGDSATSGPEIYIGLLADTTVTYSDVQDDPGVVWPGEGNINAEPCFEDADGRLPLGSPCIDVGNNDAVTVETDLDGNPRIADGDLDGIAFVDMGAYEYVDVDADNDGIEDSIDTQPDVYSDDFDDGTTFGTIMDRGDQTVVVVDEPDPDGVKIEAKIPGGPEPAQVSVCDEAAFTLDAGDIVVETCGSVEITVVQGTVEIVFFADDGTEAQTTLIAVNTIKFEPETITFIASTSNTDDVIVIVDGVEIVLAPGESKMFIRAGIDIDPDTLNLDSKGKWITCYIELPEGFDAGDIDVSTIMLNGEVPAEPHPTAVGDYDGDGVADLMVKFDRSATETLLEVGDAVQISVSGQLIDGTVFEGSDTIRVIQPGGQNK
ncbi:MAG: choice-of-anchor Q domain-containing protein [Planctomycetota bacterium]|jgi:hypothetical protein